jgi:hypothetical protein
MKILEYDNEHLNWLVLEDDSGKPRRYSRRGILPQPASPDVILGPTGFEVRLAGSALPDKLIVDIPAGQPVEGWITAVVHAGSHEFVGE